MLNKQKSTISPLPRPKISFIAIYILFLLVAVVFAVVIVIIGETDLLAYAVALVQRQHCV